MPTLEVTQVEAQDAADRLGLSPWTLSVAIRRAAVERVEQLAKYMSLGDPNVDQFDVKAFDEHVEDVRHLFVVATACSEAWRQGTDA
jgi:hypothetical protein